MSTQFCKIGNVKVGLKQLLGLKELEKQYKKYIEAAYNTSMTDASMSDMLYFEAKKIKQTILSTKQYDATF
ncbi:Lacal_2735 family protein [Bizionia sp. KMM 8389]